jgi:biopolymer transport protein ExbD
MHIGSPIKRKHARIEIIPLIDIMFFLLASFMMVSLSMTKVENIHVDLPAATQVEADFGADMIHIAVDKAGETYVERKPIALPDLFSVLTNRFRANPHLPVFIGGDADTPHGQMVQVLEYVRKAGVQNVSFSVRAEGSPAAAPPGAAPTPPAAPVPPAPPEAPRP